MVLLACVVLARYLGYLRAPAPYPSPNPPVESQLAARLFQAGNDERAARGLQPLTWDDTLAAEAADWSDRHLPGAGTDPPDVEANVIARGGCPTTTASTCYATDALPTDGDMHLGWMTSAEHRDNILDPAATAVGVGVYCGPHGIVYATAIYATTSSPPPATPATPLVHGDGGGMTCDGMARASS